jgi:hypothetical protein
MKNKDGIRAVLDSEVQVEKESRRKFAIASDRNLGEG